MAGFRFIELREFFQAINPEKVKIQKKFVIFSFFLAVSTVFWLLLALGKDYSTDLRYPVDFVNLPKGKVLVNTPPDYLTLRVNAAGYSLLRFKISSVIVPIQFDLGMVEMKEVTDKIVFVATSQAHSFISRQLGEDIQLTGIKPDSLFFEFSDLQSRKLRIIPRVSLHFEKQFTIKGEVICQPDSVQVFGPQVVLDTLTGISTEMHDFIGLNQNTHRSIRLQPSPNLKYAQASTEIIIPVEKFTEAKLVLPIEVRGLPDDLLIRTFPARIQINFLVGLSNYSRTKPYLFQAQVDYDQIRLNPKGQKVPVTISKFPDYVKVIGAFPAEVEYIIEKK